MLKDKEIEEILISRTKCWYDMAVDAEWRDIKLRGEEVLAYISVFKDLNDRYLKRVHPQRWIQLYVILSDMEVALDSDDDVDNEESFDWWAQVFGRKYWWLENAMKMAGLDV